MGVIVTPQWVSLSPPNGCHCHPPNGCHCHPAGVVTPPWVSPSPCRRCAPTMGAVTPQRVPLSPPPQWVSLSPCRCCHPIGVLRPPGRHYHPLWVSSAPNGCHCHPPPPRGWCHPIPGCPPRRLRCPRVLSPPSPAPVVVSPRRPLSGRLQCVSPPRIGRHFALSSPRLGTRGGGVSWGGDCRPGLGVQPDFWGGGKSKVGTPWGHAGGTGTPQWGPPQVGTGDSPQRGLGTPTWGRGGEPLDRPPPPRLHPPPEGWCRF